MSKRTFNLHLECDTVLELDDAVISAVDDDWRSSLYNLHTPEEIAEHIGFNIVVNGLHLSSMDGWADKDNDLAQLVGATDWTTSAHEISGSK